MITTYMCALSNNILVYITMDFKLYLILTILIILLNISKSPRVDPLRETITEEDQRAFIKCHVLLGDSAMTHKVQDQPKDGVYLIKNRKHENKFL